MPLPRRISQLSRRDARSLVGTSAGGNLVVWSVNCEGIVSYRTRTRPARFPRAVDANATWIAPPIKSAARQNDARLTVPGSGDRVRSRRFGRTRSRHRDQPDRTFGRSRSDRPSIAHDEVCGSCDPGDASPFAERNLPRDPGRSWRPAARARSLFDGQTVCNAHSARASRHRSLRRSKQLPRAQSSSAAVTRPELASFVPVRAPKVQASGCRVVTKM